jgi:hypothetical protein
METPGRHYVVFEWKVLLDFFYSFIYFPIYIELRRINSETMTEYLLIVFIRLSDLKNQNTFNFINGSNEVVLFKLLLPYLL